MSSSRKILSAFGLDVAMLEMPGFRKGLPSVKFAGGAKLGHPAFSGGGRELARGRVAPASQPNTFLTQGRRCDEGRSVAYNIGGNYTLKPLGQGSKSA